MAVMVVMLVRMVMSMRVTMVVMRVVGMCHGGSAGK